MVDFHSLLFARIHRRLWPVITGMAGHIRYLTMFWMESVAAERGPYFGLRPCFNVL